MVVILFTVTLMFHPLGCVAVSLIVNLVDVLGDMGGFGRRIAAVSTNLDVFRISIRCTDYSSK